MLGRGDSELQNRNRQEKYAVYDLDYSMRQQDPTYFSLELVLGLKSEVGFSMGLGSKVVGVASCGTHPENYMIQMTRQLQPNFFFSILFCTQLKVSKYVSVLVHQGFSNSDPSKTTNIVYRTFQQQLFP